MIFMEFREGLKQRGIMGVLHMLLHRQSALLFDQLKDLILHCQQFQVIGFLVFRPFENPAQTSDRAFDNAYGVSDQESGCTGPKN